MRDTRRDWLWFMVAFIGVMVVGTVVRETRLPYQLGLALVTLLTAIVVVSLALWARRKARREYEWDLRNLSDAQRLIRGLKPLEYTFEGKPQQTGFIAQDLDELKDQP